MNAKRAMDEAAGGEWRVVASYPILFGSDESRVESLELRHRLVVPHARVGSAEMGVRWQLADVLQQQQQKTPRLEVYEYSTR